jgi:Protein kinase domain/HD domain
LIRQLLTERVIHPEDWEHLPTAIREDLASCSSASEALFRLMRLGILTDYQVARIEAGGPGGLVLGNYRLLERLGFGSMAVVYRAEHIELRRLAAVKVLTVASTGREPNRAVVEERFTAEMRALARLQHPNIAAAIDAGRSAGSRSQRYYVMDYVPGHDLETLVRQNGPLPAWRACDLASQIASALAEAHRHKLVHRDIKPANIRVTPEGQAKLLDFGIARDRNQRLTIPGTVLGTLDYMAPEQAMESDCVDIRADLYGLGGTLFWCLTGHVPFPGSDALLPTLTRRLTQVPPSARQLVPEIPPELDALLARMMASRPTDRPPDPQAVLLGLHPFLKPVTAGRIEFVAPTKPVLDTVTTTDILPQQGQTAEAVVAALTEMAALRGVESRAHMRRIALYCRTLATAASTLPEFAGEIDDAFIRRLEGCAPLHDLGNAALPDDLLLRPDLSEEGRLVMQSHTTSGAEALERVASQYPFARDFLQMAIDIVRHHHERDDGKGYPGQLSGSAIPLSARIVAVGDVYDALRQRRPYKPALPHSAAMNAMSADCKEGRFDPALFSAFLRCASDFEQIFRENAD